MPGCAALVIDFLRNVEHEVLFLRFGQIRPFRAVQLDGFRVSLAFRCEKADSVARLGIATQERAQAHVCILKADVVVCRRVSRDAGILIHHRECPSRVNACTLELAERLGADLLQACRKDACVIADAGENAVRGFLDAFKGCRKLCLFCRHVGGGCDRILSKVRNRRKCALYAVRNQLRLCNHPRIELFKALLCTLDALLVLL